MSGRKWTSARFRLNISVAILYHGAAACESQSLAEMTRSAHSEVGHRLSSRRVSRIGKRVTSSRVRCSQCLAPVYSTRMEICGSAYRAYHNAVGRLTHEFRQVPPRNDQAVLQQGECLDRTTEAYKCLSHLSAHRTEYLTSISSTPTLQARLLKPRCVWLPDMPLTSR